MKRLIIARHGNTFRPGETPTRVGAGTDLPLVEETRARSIGRYLKDKGLKKQIAKRFCLHAPVFESWLSVLTLTRNACCHHARVWNKVNKIIPNDMRGMARPWISIPADKRRIYYNMCIIKYFLDIISPNNDMLDKMHNLFSKFPKIDLTALGFPVGWEQEPLWIQANN